MQKIAPCLWFDDQAEEAARFYVSIFKQSKVGRVSRYRAAGAKVSGKPEGSVMTVEFRIEGQDFIALNGGTEFRFTPAISFMVSCRDQEEIDRFWERLGEGGAEMQCGWVTDRFGITWQIVPSVLDTMLQDEDPVRAERVMEAFLTMKKIDIAGLQEAYQKQ